MPRKPRLIGYLRVSRSRQRTERQEDSLAAAKCWKVFGDKVSGKKWNRVGLDAALAELTPGDKLVVDAIDRLGRTAVEILTIVDQLRARGSSLLSLSERCDTATEHGRVQLLFLAVFAEIEHVNITRRTQAGVAAAAARGKPRGGRPKMTTAQIAKAHRLVKRGAKVETVAAGFGVGRSTMFRYLAQTDSSATSRLR